MAELGADLQPAGLAAHRRSRASTTGGRAACSRQDLDTLEELAAGLHRARSRSRSPARGRWPRRSRSPAATRCSATTAPGASSPRRWPRGSRDPRRRPAPPAAAASTGWSCRSTSRRWPPCSAAGCRPPPASAGTARVHPPEASAGLSGCSRRSPSRGREPWVHACAAETPLGAARGRRGPRALGRPRAADRRRPRRARRGARGGRDGRARRRPLPRPGRRRPPTREVTERVLRWLDMLGLDPPRSGERLVAHPDLRPGRRLAGWARGRWRSLRTSAGQPVRLSASRRRQRGYGAAMSDLTGKTVAIIATDFFEEAELVEPRDALREAGADVRIYSTGTDPIQAVEGDTDADPEGRRRRHPRRPRRRQRSTPSSCPGGTVNADRIRVEPSAPRTSCARRWRTSCRSP